MIRREDWSVERWSWGWGVGLLRDRKAGELVLMLGACALIYAPAKPDRS